MNTDLHYTQVQLEKARDFLRLGRSLAAQDCVLRALDAVERLSETPEVKPPCIWIEPDQEALETNVDVFGIVVKSLTLGMVLSLVGLFAFCMGALTYQR